MSVSLLPAGAPRWTANNISEDKIIRVPLDKLASHLGVGRIDRAEADSDARGDLIRLSDSDGTYQVSLDRNSVRASVDGPLPEPASYPLPGHPRSTE